MIHCAIVNRLQTPWVNLIRVEKNQIETNTKFSYCKRDYDYMFNENNPDRIFQIKFDSIDSNADEFNLPGLKSFGK